MKFFQYDGKEIEVTNFQQWRDAALEKMSQLSGHPDEICMSVPAEFQADAAKECYHDECYSGSVLLSGMYLYPDDSIYSV